ncbi:uncharacterized protein LOC115080889 isoform X2 [Rhinatrema bivittatum]|uniref:uncharacterized protein LOC115080889 isoform X2 n=1 Tax=Rhinatrema bivittatum TaxID=194408 RepID=UPI00112CACBD|nr:uncharacterized protein LOC115080889 isoform X2 [Rhinatrema bivittatum]
MVSGPEEDAKWCRKDRSAGKHRAAIYKIPRDGAKWSRKDRSAGKDHKKTLNGPERTDLLGNTELQSPKYHEMALNGAERTDLLGNTELQSPKYHEMELNGPEKTDLPGNAELISQDPAGSCREEGPSVARFSRKNKHFSQKKKNKPKTSPKHVKLKLFFISYNIEHLKYFCNAHIMAEFIVINCSSHS